MPPILSWLLNVLIWRGGEVKCEGDKITVITKGDPSVLEEAFGLNMEVDRTLCSMVESEEREVVD